MPLEQIFPSTRQPSPCTCQLSPWVFHQQQDFSHVKNALEVLNRLFWTQELSLSPLETGMPFRGPLQEQLQSCTVLGICWWGMPWGSRGLSSPVLSSYAKNVIIISIICWMQKSWAMASPSWSQQSWHGRVLQPRTAWALASSWEYLWQSLCPWGKVLWSLQLSLKQFKWTVLLDVSTFFLSRAP